MLSIKVVYKRLEITIVREQMSKCNRSTNFELTLVFGFFLNALWPCRSFSADGKVISCDQFFGHDNPSKSSILPRQAKVKTTRSVLPSSLLSARYFPAFSLNN